MEFLNLLFYSFAILKLLLEPILPSSLFASNDQILIYYQNQTFFNETIGLNSMINILIFRHGVING